MIHRLWHWLWASSVRRQLIVGVALVHMLLMTIFVFDLVHRQRDYLAERAKSRVLIQAQLLAGSSIQGAMSNDLGGLSEILAVIGKDKDISQAMVTDSTGRVLADLRGLNVGLFRNDERTLDVLGGTPQPVLVDVSLRSVEAAAPISAQGRVIGWAWVARSLEPEQAHLAYVTHAGLIYTAAAILIGTIFAFLLAGRVTRQLRLLLAGTHRMADNLLDLDVPVTTDNEVGQVTRAFNAAMRRLSTQQEQLRESEERFRVAQELSPDGFLIFRPLRDNTGVVTDFLWIYENEAAARMNDTTLEEVCGKRVSEVMPHHQESPFHKAYKEVAETGQVRVVEEAFYDKDTFQQRRWFRAAAVPTTAGDVAILVQNLTERKLTEEALQESESRYRSLFDSMNEGFGLHDLIFDAEGKPCDFRFLELNPAWEKLTGVPREKAVGRTMKQVWPNLASSWLEVFSKVAMTGEPIRYENYHDELQRWHETFVYSTKPNQFAMLLIDITERKKAEEGMRELNQNFMEKNRELEEANKEMESFIYSISHDLRGPLRVISGFSQLLTADSADSLDEKKNNYLRRIQTGAVKMSQLIDDLLNLSRISRQDINKTVVDLSSMASGIMTELCEYDPGRKVVVEIKAGMRALADYGLMHVMLTNLLGNAWKFTSKVEDARIEFTAADKNGGTVYYVRDNGAGFNPAHAHKMFLPFHRLHGESEFEGTGIGLSIVERIIHRHGGRIWAEGEEDKGATIFFTMD